MDREKLDELWRILSSATNIDKLDYGEAVTIGSVFGQMRSEIERLQNELVGYKISNNSLSNALDKALRGQE